MRNWLRQLAGRTASGTAVADADEVLGEVLPPKKPHLADHWRGYEPSPYNYAWGADVTQDTAQLREWHAAARAAVARGEPQALGPVSCVTTDRTKILIYGAGLYREEAEPLLTDRAWEVWALNLCVPLDRLGRLRADVWFDLHQRCAQSADDLRWIADCPVPIYVPPDLLNAGLMATPFPLGVIEAEFGSYFSCTFAYQIALVLWMRRHGRDVTDLGLYGVELAWGPQRERTVEWACTAYWLGRAEEAGLTIHLPAKSTLGRHFGRYGFEYEHERDEVLEYLRAMEEADVLRRKMGGPDAGYTGG